MRILVVRHDSKQHIKTVLIKEGFDILMAEGKLNVVYPRTKEIGDKIKKIDPNCICPSTDYAKDKDCGYGHFVTTTPIEGIVVKLGADGKNVCEPCEHGYVITTP